MKTPTPLTSQELTALIQELPTMHRLRTAPDSYRAGFIAAFLYVIGDTPAARKILQDKYFIPQTATYNDEQFLQYAAELSVANHVARHPAVAAWELEKQVRPPKDVWFRRGVHRVSLEVKCPRQEEVPENATSLSTAGRLPDLDSMVASLQNAFNEAPLPPELQSVRLAKNKDLRLKQALVSAHDKFSEISDLDDLNVLLLACGDELMEWHNYLHERQGLFTPTSFHPRQDFCRTQVVLVTNLRYFHTICMAQHDWTLKDVFLLPFINPVAEPRVTTEAIVGGLGIFDHHLKSFTAYRPTGLDPAASNFVPEAVRVTGYIHGALSDEEFVRFFPGTTRRGRRTPPKP